jgi:hypothetical protein
MLAAAAALAGAGALRAAPATAGVAASGPLLTYSQDFESGMDFWTPASDHNERDYRIVRTDAGPVFSGKVSLEYFLNGANDDGTIWVERRFTGLPAGMPVAVSTSFHLHSEVQSRVNTWPVVAYAGPAQPRIEQDFTIVGQTNQVAGWAQYKAVEMTRTDGVGALWVAFGIGATWEVSRTYYLDLVEVSVASMTGSY